MIFRHYKNSDRSDIREICCDTADCGRPVENIFSDREVFADLLTVYYTDFDPQAIWVAEEDNRIIGYLLGCFDTHRYNSIMLWHILPRVIIKAIVRGIFFKSKNWRLFLTLLKSWQMGGFNRNIPIDKYPAHLHINVKEGFRGQRIGTNLIEYFFEQARKANIRGVHLTTSSKNIFACRFFEKVGFQVFKRYPMMFCNNNNCYKGHTIVYTKTLD